MDSDSPSAVVRCLVHLELLEHLASISRAVGGSPDGRRPCASLVETTTFTMGIAHRGAIRAATGTFW